MDVLLNSTLPIPTHAIAAMIAIVIGAIQLLMKKGTHIHRLLGWVWIGLLIIVCVTSFFIYEIKLWGNYSPIHLLSVFTLFSLGGSVYYAQNGMIKQHRISMISIYFLALILTGFFTLLPGRIMNEVLFG